MPEKLWKRTERAVAEILGGKRVPITGRSRGSAPDVEHDHLSIEVKEKASIPKWITEAVDQAVKSIRSSEQVPIVVVHKKGNEHLEDLVIMRLGDFKKLSWWDEQAV